MPRHRLLTLGAIVAALALLAVTLIFGRGGGEDARRDPLAERHTPSATPDVSTRFDPDRAIGEGQRDGLLVEDLRDGHYRMRGEDRETLLFYDRVRPREGDVIDVTGPIVQMFFGPGRVVEIRAEQCTLEAPDNEPRRGRFEGGVEVTIYEAGDGERVDLASTRHIQLRAHVDAAEFDMELGHMESTGPVTLLGPRVAFVGEDLSLTYNPLRRQLQRLVVQRGESLHLRRAPASAPASGTAAGGGDARPPSMLAASSPSDDSTPPAAAAPDASEVADAGPWYRARFQREVRIEAEGTAGGEAAFAADTLEAVFQFAGVRSGDDEAAAARVDGGGRLMPEPTIQLVSDVPASPAPAPASAPAPAAGGADLQWDVDEAEVVITWVGRLHIEPEPTPPAEDASRGDVLLRLVGGPATARLADGQSLTAPEITYLAGPGRLRAAGSEAVPVTLRDAGLGTAVGRRLMLDEQAGRGELTGPGRLTMQRGGEQVTTPAATPAADADADLEALEVTWVRELALAFDPRGAREGRSGAGGGDGAAGLGTLRRASFVGDVAVAHEQFDLIGGQVDVIMAPAVGVVEAIEAHEAVSLRARQVDNAAEQADADADDVSLVDAAWLRLELDAEADEATPRRLLARDGVRVRHAELDLAADRLDATLAPGEGGGTVTLAQVEAEGAVDVHVAAVAGRPDSRLRGHRLVVDPAAERLALSGREGEPASIERPGETLTGQDIHLAAGDQTGQLEVRGPGTLAADLDDAEGGRLTVAWTRSLTFDDATGDALVLGSVRAGTLGDTARTELRSETLRLALDPAGVVEPGGEPGAEGRLRWLQAEDGARLTAERWEAAGGDEPVSSFRMDGPTIRFDQREQMVTVPAAGTMLVVDARPAEAAEVGDVAGEVAGARFTGRGSTLFTWADSLALDAAANNVTMSGQVQMVHLPAGEQHEFQLDAGELVADLEQTGGLARWRDSEAVSPEIRFVRGEGRIAIRHAGRTITGADHLLYDGERERVELWADAGRMVEVRDADRPVAMPPARRLIWDLARDRFEARDLGPGIVPVE
ncbi:MAG: hypothetical protein WD009_03650 [Phycisphaeraceae bacterium]